MDLTDVIQIDINSNIDGANKAKRSMEEIAEQTKKLQSQLKGGTIDLATFNYQMSRMDKQSKGAAAGFNSAMGGATKLGGKFGLAAGKMMQFGQLLDDAQYIGEQGLRPVIGQIMQLSPAFGTALIAGQALYNNWSSLTALFGGTAIKSAKEEMEELAKKTSLTADEAERLARAQAPGAKVKELQAGQTDEQSSRDAAVTRAIIEAGSDDVARGVLRVAPQLVDRQGDAAVAADAVARAKESLDSAKAGAGQSEDMNAIPEAERKLREATEKLATARETTAASLAATGALSKLFPGGLNQLRGLVESSPNSFGPKGNQLRKDLAEASKSPDEQQAEAAQDHADAQERQNQDRLARLGMDEEERGRQFDEQQDQAERAHREKLADWQERNRAQAADELVRAKAADMMENRNRTSQVIGSSSGLRDSIQQSIKKDNTNEQQLRTSQQIEALARRQVEQLSVIANRVGGPARAG